jgi:hypothetical protein
MKKLEVSKMERIEGGSTYCDNMSITLSGAYARGDWDLAIRVAYWAGKANCWE